MRYYNYLITVGIIFIILNAFSFSVYKNKENTNNLIYFEYKIDALSNLERRANDFIVKSQFIKSDSWARCEHKLPLCETGTYINRIALDSIKLSDEISINKVLQSLYAYVNEGNMPNDGLPLELNVDNNPVTIIVFLRHKHDTSNHLNIKFLMK